MNRTTKKRMQALLDSLDYDFSQFTLADFARWLERRRGRKIVFTPCSLPPKVFGAWIKGGDEDFVFFEQDTPVVHKAHNQLHELAHMLCGHPTVEIDSQQAEALLRFSDDKTLLLRSASLHSDENEREAEVLASLIQERALHYARLEELYKPISSEDGVTDYLAEMENFT